MSTKPHILAMAGSTRHDSYNKRLARIAALGAEAAGAEVTVIDLRDLPLPLFDEDLEREEGPPEAATKLKGLLVKHDGLIVASPEYNSSISAVLKNAIDWASRPAPGESPLVAFRGKVASLLSASPGRWAGCGGWFICGRSWATSAWSSCRTRSPSPGPSGRSRWTGRSWTRSGSRPSRGWDGRWPGSSPS